MANLAQVEANLKNAQKSTGPVTELRKAVVSKNAVRHGILSTHVFIEEDESNFTGSGFIKRAARRNEYPCSGKAS